MAESVEELKILLMKVKEDSEKVGLNSTFQKLWFVKVVYYIDWFVDIEESLHPWDKAHLVMVYDLFNVLLDSDC